MQFGPHKNNRIHIDKEWIAPIILLMIPGVRFIGALVLLKRVKDTFHLSGASAVLLYIAAIMLMTGSVGEFIGGAMTLIIPLTIVALAVVTLLSVAKGKDDKLSDYVACIGDSDSYDIDQLMNEMGVDEKQLRKDINALKKKGMISKTAYIDKGHRLLVLRPEGKPQAAPRGKTQSAARPAEKPQQPPMTEEEREYHEIILEIRALNIAIDDEKVSERIDRIEQITANIFHLVQQRPERKKDIQTFMEYYLPTTLKLLRHYARLEQQPVSGENIASSRQRIEAILDKLVVGFEQQLDVLFKSEAHDITTDIKVLEKMMQMDGLG